MSIKSQKDFVSGLMFTAVGAGFAWNAALSYDIGSASQMGPGYFPLVLGLVLVLLGGFIMFFALVVETPDGGVIGSIAWRPLVCILGANLLFGALLGGLPSIGFPSFGLVVAIPSLMFWRYFRARVDAYVLAMEVASERFVRHVLLTRGQA